MRQHRIPQENRDVSSAESDLVGRDAHWHEVEQRLQVSLRDGVAVHIPIVGASGFGKTAFLTRIAPQIGNHRFVLAATCHEILRTDPGLICRRLLSAATEVADKHGDRYLAGLEDALFRTRDSSARLSATEVEQLLLRMLDGMLCDRGLAIVVDDLQWIDPESLASIAFVFQQLRAKPLAVITATRPEAEEVSFYGKMSPIEIGPLSDADATSLVARIGRAITPDAKVAIVAASGGNPLSIRMLIEHVSAATGSSSSSLSEVRATLVKAKVERSRHALRRFLEICATLGDPIEIRMLRQIYSDKDLDELLREACPDFIYERNGTLTFVHPSYADAIKAARTRDLPINREIARALDMLPAKSLTEYERLAAANHAIGKSNEEQRALLDAAELALSERLWQKASSLFQKALDIRPAPPLQVGSILHSYSMALRLSDRDRDAKRLLLDALEDKYGAVNTGRGLLLANLCNVLFSLGEEGAIEKTVSAYEPGLSQIERRQVSASRAGIAVLSGDFTSAERLLRLLDVPDDVSGLDADEYVLSKRVSAGAMYQAVTGHSSEASEALSGESGVRLFRDDVVARFLEMQSALVELHRAGPKGIQNAVCAPTVQEFDTSAEHWMIVQFCVGQWERIDAYISEANIATASSRKLVRMAALHLAACVLRKIRSPIESAFRNAADDLAGSPERAHSMAFAYWWSAYTIIHRLNPTSFVNSRMRSWLQRSWPVMPASALQLGAAEYAVRSGDSDLALAVEQLTEEKKALTWRMANSRLAAAWALQVKTPARSQFHARMALVALRQMGAPLLAALAAQLAKQTSPADLQLLRRLRLAETSPSEEKADLTARESEIARLVGNGLTNREIAERLVLSERTIEVHLSHIFGKMNVRRRTELIVRLKAIDPYMSDN